VQTHKRKRLEIVVEKRRAPAVLELLDREPGITGWTMLPCIGGRGHTGTRLPEGATDALDTVLILVVTSEEVAHRTMAAVLELLEEFVGVVLMSDVEVARPGHF
jgi:PII-like signaling protein